eukprot:9470379-Pyramimonas_sp.AAC.1
MANAARHCGECGDPMMRSALHAGCATATHAENRPHAGCATGTVGGALSGGTKRVRGVPKR